MTRQIKIIFAILFGFNVLLAIVGIVIGASLPAIFLPASSAIWIAMYYHQLKDYAELMDSYIFLQAINLKEYALHLKSLDIIKEGLTREWASPEEFEKWKDEKIKELFKDEED